MGKLSVGSKSQIFARHWQYVGNSSWLGRDGDYFCATIANEPVVLVRNANETRVLSNVCRHRGSLITKGAGNCQRFKCPYHGWTYDFNGKLKGAPEFQEARDFYPEQLGLPEYRVESLGPFLFVNLSNDGPSLEEALSPLVEELARANIDLNAYLPIYRRDYLVHCNWKVYVDNYLEGYHIPVAHPSLFQELDYTHYEVRNVGFTSQVLAPLRTRGEKRHYQDSDASEALYFWVFPNFMINVYPDNLSVNFVYPQSTDRTLTVFEWFSKVGERESRKYEYYPVCKQKPEEPVTDEIAKIISFSHQVQLEDITICENVQKGLRSRSYDSGRFSPRRESGVHHFHRLLFAELSRCL